MLRDKQFVAIVSAGAIAGEIEALVSRGALTVRRGAEAVVARATEIPEEAIPYDVSEAAHEFLRYALGRSAVAPGWYVAWRESLVRRPSW